MYFLSCVEIKTIIIIIIITIIIIIIIKQLSFLLWRVPSSSEGFLVRKLLATNKWTLVIAIEIRVQAPKDSLRSSVKKNMYNCFSCRELRWWISSGEKIW